MFKLGQKETFICDHSHHEYTFVDELEGEGGREGGREGRGREGGRGEEGGEGKDKEMVGRRGEVREREGEREDGGWRGKDGGKDRKKINAMLILYKFVVAPPPPLQCTKQLQSQAGG